MNYRHAFHAGNFADVFKHAVLVLVAEYLQRKPKPCLFLDTHAGAGAYDLRGETARRSGEAREGIVRVLAARNPPEELAPYLRRLKACGLAPAGTPRSYPGSPLLLASMLRADDRMIAVELHPEEFMALKGNLAGTRGANAIHMNGYQALKALLPPKERRGMVLIDPPFEDRDELRRLGRELKQAHRRWATGVYLLWYPIKDPRVLEAFRRDLADSGFSDVLLAELEVFPPNDFQRLNGCGLAIINPPYPLEAQLRALLPFLCDLLRRDPHASWRLETVTGGQATAAG